MDSFTKRTHALLVGPSSLHLLQKLLELNPHSLGVGVEHWSPVTDSLCIYGRFPCGSLCPFFQGPQVGSSQSTRKVMIMFYLKRKRHRVLVWDLPGSSWPICKFSQVIPSFSSANQGLTLRGIIMKAQNVLCGTIPQNVKYQHPCNSQFQREGSRRVQENLLHLDREVAKLFYSPEHLTSHFMTTWKAKRDKSRAVLMETRT